MKAQKTSPQPELSTILLLLAVISALFVLFTYMLNQRPAKDYFPPGPTPTVVPVTTSKDLDMMLEDLNKQDSTAQINTELLKLSTDASGI